MTLSIFILAVFEKNTFEDLPGEIYQMKSNLVPNFVHVHILNFKFMNSSNLINTLNIKDTVRVDLGKSENPTFHTLHFPPKKTKTKRKEVLKINNPEVKIKTVVFEIVVQ